MFTQINWRKFFGCFLVFSGFLYVSWGVKRRDKLSIEVCSNIFKNNKTGKRVQNGLIKIQCLLIIGTKILTPFDIKMFLSLNLLNLFNLECWSFYFCTHWSLNAPKSNVKYSHMSTVVWGWWCFCWLKTCHEWPIKNILIHITNESRYLDTIHSLPGNR